MLVLPIPLAVALVLAFLATRLALLREGPCLFPVLLATAALQGLVISLVQHYGLTSLFLLQPVTAAIVPPLAYLAFQQAAIRALRWPRDLIHALSPLLLLPALMIGLEGAPMLPDVVLAAMFIGYGGAILIRATSGIGLPRALLGQDTLPARVWQVVGSALVLSAASDVAIALALHEGMVWLRPLIVSLVSSVALLSIGLLCLLGGRPEREESSAAARNDETPASASDATHQGDAAIIARLDALLTDERFYLDPDLTLARLARRLGLPAKTLSAAVNRVTGENISRYVNARRIRHACDLLERGESVTSAMLESGFNTKSNFNREFLRVTGKTPSAFQATRANA
jgi:AraC-like DNA-binding protein